MKTGNGIVISAWVNLSAIILVVILSGIFIVPIVSAEFTGMTVRGYRPITNHTANNMITLDYSLKPPTENYTINLTLWNSTYSEKLLSQNHSIGVSSTWVNLIWNATSTLGKNIEYNISIETMVPNGTIVDNRSIKMAYLQSEVAAKSIYLWSGMISNTTGNLSILDFSSSLNVSLVMNFNTTNPSGGSSGVKDLDILLYTQPISLGSVSGFEDLNLVLLVDDANQDDKPVANSLIWRTMSLYYSQVVVDLKNINENTIKVQFYNETSSSWQNDNTLILDTVKNIITTNATHLTLQKVVAETNPPPPPPSPPPTPSSSSSSSSSSNSGSSSFGNIFIPEPPKPKLNITLLNEVYQKWTREFAEEEQAEHLKEIILENERIKNKTYDTVVVVSEVKDDIISQIVWLIKVMLGLQ